MSKYSSNKAGAKYGTGYCDSQCPRDLKFIDGKVCTSTSAVFDGVADGFDLKANVEDWKPSSNDPNAGVGGMGSCCAEMDIWEANSSKDPSDANPSCKTPSDTARCRSKAKSYNYRE